METREEGPCHRLGGDTSYRLASPEVFLEGLEGREENGRISKVRPHTEELLSHCITDPQGRSLRSGGQGRHFFLIYFQLVYIQYYFVFV